MTSSRSPVGDLSSATQQPRRRVHRVDQLVCMIGTGCVTVTAPAFRILEPPLPDDYAARLHSLHDAGMAALLSFAGFTALQLFLIAAALGTAHLLRDSAPRLGVLGAALSLVGAFCHAVYGGASFSLLVIAGLPNSTANTAIAERVDNAAVLTPFLGIGLIGLVGGIVLQSIGLLRSQVGPRWLPPLLWAFLILEVFSGALPGLGLISVAFLALAYIILAREMFRHW